MGGMIWLICFALFKACSSLSWTSTISNNTIMYACINDTLVFPWNFSKGDNEELVATKWFFNAPGQQERLLSIETETQFIRSPGVDNRLQFLPNAGISISNVNQSEFGIYSVRVVMKLLHSRISEFLLQIYSQTAIASLPDPPISNNGLLQITLLSNAAFQPSTGQFHLEFTFGKFLDFGRPSVTAIWTTPSNTTLPTSRSDNDSFILTVPNPIEEGVYFSQLKIPDVLARCSVVTPLLKERYNTSVRATDARLTIVETVQRSQQALLQLQEAELRQLGGWNRPRSCADVRKYDQMNGIHRLYLPGNKTVRAYCDQTTDNGGWTVIQRRKDGSVDFNRNWAEYESGFGDLQADHWLGLTSIHLLTYSGDYSLRVDLTDYSDNKFYALYSEFSVGSSSDTYRLTANGYSGTAGDALANNNKFEFLTFERQFSGNCVNIRGGWWLTSNINSCSYGALNGPFRTTNIQSEDSIVWYSENVNSWRQYKSFKRAEMKVRPKG